MKEITWHSAIIAACNLEALLSSLKTFLEVATKFLSVIQLTLLLVENTIPTAFGIGRLTGFTNYVFTIICENSCVCNNLCYN